MAETLTDDTRGDLAAPGGAAVVVRRPGRAEVHPQRYTVRRRVIELSLAVGVPLFLLLLWQLASSRNWIDGRLYPSPSDIVTSERLRTQALWSDVWTSVQRMLKGFAIGAGGGMAVGLGMGMSRLVRAALDPMLTALYTVPKLALIPVFVTIFGFGDSPRIALIAVTVFFFVWISTMAAIMSVPEGYREAARSFGVNRWEMFRHVLLPGSLPQIFVGLRIAAGVAVLILIGVELVLAGDGLGHLINQGRLLFRMEQTYVGIALAALLGLAFTWVIRLIGRLVIPWAPEDKAPAQG